MMSRLKVGIIGCGWFGNYHLDILRRIEGVEVAALASSNPEKLKSTGVKVSGARLYGDHRAMYEAEEHLDAVFVCVPPDSHRDAEILAAQRGIHLYVEKPVALSLEKAAAVANAVAKAGIIAAVGYQERYNEALEQVKKYLSGREVGLASGRWLGDIPGASWWRRKERSGGQIVEQSTHLFDLLRYFLGEAEAVSSVARKGIVRDVPGYDLEDYSATTVVFQSGAIATVLTGCYLAEMPDYAGIGLQIACRDTVVEYDWYQEVRYFKGNCVERVSVPGSSHERAVRMFIEAVKTGNAALVRSDYADAVKTLALTLAANESIVSGKTVYL